jgi:hypothetical protein
MVRQSIMVAEVCGKEAIHFMVDRKLRVRQGGARDKTPPRTHPPFSS